MKKFLVLMSMVAALALLVVPAYAVNPDTVDVFITVEHWVELTVTEDQIDLNVAGSAGATGFANASVKCNGAWHLDASAAALSNYLLYVDLTVDGGTADFTTPSTTDTISGSKTAPAYGVDVWVHVPATDSTGAYLDPSTSSTKAGTVTLTAAIN